MVTPARPEPPDPARPDPELPDPARPGPAGATSAPLPPPREPHGPYRVCLVCLGNICRSPMAEALLRAAVTEAGLAGAVTVDSAGTGDWHLGQGMNPQARAALSHRGLDGSAHRARQIRPGWLEDRDLILAMDAANLSDLRAMAGQAGHDRIRLFGEVGRLSEPGGAEIPDPYGGSDDDFGHVLDLLGAAAPVVAARLAQLLGRPAEPA